MSRETLPSMIEDRQAQRLADFLEDDLVKIYVYEQVIVKNKYITLLSRGVTYVTIATATAIPQVTTEGEHYFEALAEITDTGTLQAVDKTNMASTKFINISSVSLITNGFKKLLNDTPKLYTIGKPFSYDAYVAGDQGVYTATIEPTGYFSKTDLVDNQIVNAADLLEDIELTEMTLNNLNSVEKQLDNARLVILPYALNLEDPRVDVQKGKYIVYPFDTIVSVNKIVNHTIKIKDVDTSDWFMPKYDNVVINTLNNGRLNLFITDVNAKGDDTADNYVLSVTMPQIQSSPQDFGSSEVTLIDYQVARLLNKPDGAIVNTRPILSQLTVEDLHTVLVAWLKGDKTGFIKSESLLSNFLSIHSALFIPSDNIAKYPVIPLGAKYPTRPQPPVGLVFPHQIKDSALELKLRFNYLRQDMKIGGDAGRLGETITNSGDTIDTYDLDLMWTPQMSSLEYQDVVPTNSSDNFTVLKTYAINDGIFFGEAGKSYINANSFQYFLPNQPGFKVELSSQALVSSINATAMQNGIRQDLGFKTTTDLIPLMVRVLDDRDRVEISLPWFNPELTPPLYWLKSFLQKDGGSLTSLIKNEEDLKVLHDMMIMTKLVKDKFREVPVEKDKNEIPYGSKFGIYADGATNNAIKGGTAALINDGLFANWMEFEVLDMSDERVLRMRCAITLLSDYIASSYAIGSGTNKFNRAQQPYYLRNTTPLIANSAVIDGAASRWMINSILPTTKDVFKNDIKTILKQFGEVKFKLYSEYFNVSEGGLYPQQLENLSDIVIKKAEGNVAIPKLPATLSRQKVISYGADLDIKSDDAMSHIVYLAVEDVLSANFMFLWDETTVLSDPKTPLTKTFDLPDVYDEDLSDEQIKSKIEDYVYSNYGLKPGEFTYTAPVKEVYAPIRTFTNAVDDGKRGWPNWLTNNVPYEWSGTWRNNDYLIKYILRKSDAFNDLVEHDTYLEEDQVKRIVRNIDSDFKNVPLEKIIITNYAAAKAAGDLQIFCNYNWIGANQRWWRINFSYTLSKVKYTNITITFKTAYKDHALNTRPISMNKSEWYAWLKAINTSQGILYKNAVHEYTLWTDNKIDFIESIDLSALFVDEFNIIINGFRIPVPALNRETPTLTYQKVILP